MDPAFAPVRAGVGLLLVADAPAHARGCVQRTRKPMFRNGLSHSARDGRPSEKKARPRIGARRGRPGAAPRGIGSGPGEGPHSAFASPRAKIEAT
jgi:hypothetical protein